MLSNEEITQLKKQYGHIYLVEVLKDDYLFRRLTKREYQDISEMDLSDEEKEDLVCYVCIVDPQNIDWDEKLGGIPSTLASVILLESGFDEEYSASLLSSYREEMNSLETQMEAVILEAFPRFTIEEIESWDVPKTLRYFSRAEWLLAVMRGIEVNKILEEINKPFQQGVQRGNPQDFPETVNEFHTKGRQENRL